MKPPSRLASGHSSASAASSLLRKSTHRSISASNWFSSGLLRRGQLGLQAGQRLAACGRESPGRGGWPGRWSPGPAAARRRTPAAAPRGGRRPARRRRPTPRRPRAGPRMAAASASGLATQSASSREPMAVAVRSSTASSEPSRRPSRMVRVISRLRRLDWSISSVPDGAVGHQPVDMRPARSFAFPPGNRARPRRPRSPGRRPSLSPKPKPSRLAV